MLLIQYLALSDAEKFELIEVATNREFKNLIQRAITATKEELCNLVENDPIVFQILYTERRTRLQSLNDLETLINQIHSELIERNRHEMVSQIPI